MAETDQTEVLDNLSDQPAELTVEQAVAKWKELQVGQKPAKQAKPEADNQEVPEEDTEGALAAEEASDNEPDGESAPEEEEQAEPVTLKLPDGEVITADEAVQGYLRKSDYSRRQQQLSQREKDAQAQIAATLASIEGLHKEVTSLQPQEPDWLAIKREYPDQWQDMRLQWETDSKRREKIAAGVREERQKAIQSARAKAWGDLISGEFDPKWKNPQALNQDLAKTFDWASQQGISRDRLDSVTDAADVIAWEKARRYDEIMALSRTGKKAVAGKPKVMKPQARPKTSAAVNPAVVERFNKTRSIDDAVALYRAAKSASSKGASQRRH